MRRQAALAHLRKERRFLFSDRCFIKGHCLRRFFCEQLRDRLTSAIAARSRRLQRKAAHVDAWVQAARRASCVKSRHARVTVEIRLDAAKAAGQLRDPLAVFLEHIDAQITELVVVQLLPAVLRF